MVPPIAHRTGRAARRFSRLFDEGIALLDAVQDVHLDQQVTLARPGPVSLGPGGCLAVALLFDGDEGAAQHI